MIKVKTSDLQRAITSASKAIGSNPVLPILSDFKIEVHDNVMTITATDLELTVIEKIACEAKKNESFAFPAKVLLDTVKEIKEPELIIETTGEKATIKLEKAKGKYSTSIQSVKDYPNSPEIEDAQTIKTDRLQKAIGKVLFATSSDDLRPAMTGVLVEIGFEQTRVVATDAHVLSRYVINEKSEFEGSFIIPKKAAAIIKEMKGPLVVSFGNNNVHVKQENTVVICRLIDARYPDYKSVIPVDNSNSIVITKSDLKGSLRRANIYANRATNLAIFNMGEMTKISSQDLDFANEAVEEIKAELKGEEMTIGFNGRIVLSCLELVDGESVQIDYSSPTRAAIISENELTMLLMPVLLN
jgi:DNA polymerase III subunit beta